MNVITDIARLFRFEYLFFALLLPVLGMATVNPQLQSLHLFWALVTSFSFHIYISLLNDVIDLPLDRTNKRRRDYPLVKGTISRNVVFAIALIQIPILALLILFWGPNLQMILACILVLGMMTIYNLFGKRTRIPILTDIVQGLGFGGIVLFGAASVGELTPLSIAAFLGIINWMLLANLVGGLRDLESDYSFTALTVPIYLGSRCDGSAAQVSIKTVRYGRLVVFSQFAISLWIGNYVLGSTSFFEYFLIGLLILLAICLVVIERYFLVTTLNSRAGFELGLLVMFLESVPLFFVFALSGSILFGFISAFIILNAGRKIYLYRQAIRKLPYGSKSFEIPQSSA